MRACIRSGAGVHCRHDGAKKDFRPHSETEVFFLSARVYSPFSTA